MKRTADQNIRLHTLIGKLGIDKDTKREMVLTHTGGRSESSADLSYQECDKLINFLGQQMPDYKVKGYTLDDIRADKMRKKILSVCHELGWEDEKGKIDWPRLNDYLNKYGYLHKGLNDYKYKELPTLVTQFENLLRTRYAAR